MSQQNYKLKQVSTIFKKLQKDKTKSSLKPLEFILEMNTIIGFDQILIREGYQSYAQINKLQQKKVLKQYQNFFSYMKKDVNMIEANYLKNTNDIKLIEEAQNNNQTQFNFLLNKNNVSKFIRDQAAHYQLVLDKYLEPIPDLEDEKGIHTHKWHNFFIDFFKNKYTAIIKNNQIYLDKSAAEMQVEMGHILKTYAKQIRQVSQKQSQKAFYITEDNVLDFLTFWLKKQSQNNLFVVYARTKGRLIQETAFITGQTNSSGVHLHPSRMTSQQIILKQKQFQQQIKQEQLKAQILQAQTQKIQQPITINQQQAEVIEQTNIATIPIIDLPAVIRHERMSNVQNPQPINQKKRELTKQQLLKNQLKSLFEFGCKRRYTVSKYTTFQEIQSQSKTMTVQKFISFCNYFDLLSIITKELLIEYFKMNALNLRTIDFIRFEKIIAKMIAVDQRIIRNLLQKSKFDRHLKKKQMKSSNKNHNPLSHYKFVLYPINGKDISSLQKDISYKRLEKIMHKQQRDKQIFQRKQQAIQQKSIIPSRQIKNYYNKKGIQRNYSQLRKMGNSKVSHIDLEQIRDNSFNPEKFITINDNDKLWQAYEAKIWNKQQNTKSALQNILSKRIQKGKTIINKYNSQISLIHE